MKRCLLLAALLLVTPCAALAQDELLDAAPPRIRTLPELGNYFHMFDDGNMLLLDMQKFRLSLLDRDSGPRLLSASAAEDSPTEAAHEFLTGPSRILALNDDWLVIEDAADLSVLVPRADPAAYVPLRSEYSGSHYSFGNLRPVWSRAALLRDRVVVFAGGNTLEAFNMDGSLAWSTLCVYSSDVCALPDGERVLVSGLLGTLLMVNREGECLWDRPDMSFCATDGEGLVCGTGNDFTLRMLDMDGNELWNFPQASDLQPLAIVNGAVLASGRRLVARIAAGGSLEWQHELPVGLWGFCSGSAARDGHCFIMAQIQEPFQNENLELGVFYCHIAQAMYCFNPDGTLLWKDTQKLISNMDSHNTLPGGWLYQGFGDYEGGLTLYGPH